jgi:hypothetical protein
VPDVQGNDAPIDSLDTHVFSSGALHVASIIFRNSGSSGSDVTQTNAGAIRRRPLLASSHSAGNIVG